MIQIPVKKICHRVIRGCIHPILLRYGNELRGFYHSRLGHAIFQSSGFLGILTRWIKRLVIGHNEVVRLATLLKLGFSERALMDLEKIACHNVRLAERLNASWELSVYYSNNYTQKDACNALKHLDFILRHDKNIQRIKQSLVLKAEFLERLDRIKEAIELVQPVVDQNRHEDLYLALANLYAKDITITTREREQQRLCMINAVLGHYNLEMICKKNSEKALGIDNIYVPDCLPGKCKDGPLITVIMPAYNSQEFISIALSSLLTQTWENMEIIVVDDASTDNTRKRVESLMEKDSRIRYLFTSKNQGPYVARNLGLFEAKGEFITCHDADDWSHPRKIELQVQHLLSEANIIGSMSRLIRSRSDMFFHRRGNPGFYLAKNFSSLMFRHKEAVTKAGFWDCVRFAGDSEYIRRLEKIFGGSSVRELQTGPLSIVRQDSVSLTGGEFFGYSGFFMGSRKAYVEAYRQWHSQIQSPYMEFPQEKRPFPIPAPMSTISKQKANSIVNYMDVVIAIDFRLTGKFVDRTMEEIKAQKAIGLKTGLVHLARFDLNPSLSWNEKILSMVDSRTLHLLVYGQEVTCDLLKVYNHQILQEYQTYLPKIKAKKIIIIVDEAPYRNHHDHDLRLYNLKRCSKNIERYFESPGIWYPFNSDVREALLKEPEVNNIIKVAGKDWVNIVDEIEEKPQKYYDFISN